RRMPTEPRNGTDGRLRRCAGLARIHLHDQNSHRLTRRSRRYGGLRCGGELFRSAVEMRHCVGFSRGVFGLTSGGLASLPNRRFATYRTQDAEAPHLLTTTCTEASTGQLQSFPIVGRSTMRKLPIVTLALAAALTLACGAQTPKAGSPAPMAQASAVLQHSDLLPDEQVQQVLNR